MCIGKNSSFVNFGLWVGSWGLQMCWFEGWSLSLYGKEKKQNKFPSILHLPINWVPIQLICYFTIYHATRFCVALKHLHTTVVVWKVADCGRFPIKLHKSRSGLQPLNNPVSRQFFIPRVSTSSLLFNQLVIILKSAVLKILNALFPYFVFIWVV
jgi:hypothetical protein